PVERLRGEVVDEREPLPVRDRLGRPDVRVERQPARVRLYPDVGDRDPDDGVRRRVRGSRTGDGRGRRRERGYSSESEAAERCLISSTTAGSASVVVSPSGRFSATSRSKRRMILPLLVFGSSCVNRMLAGFAIRPITSATCSRSSSSISTEPSRPSL